MLATRPVLRDCSLCAQVLELTGLVLVDQVLAQPSMPRLRSLKLRSDRHGEARSADAFARLVAAPWFSQLQELSITAQLGPGSARLAPLRAAPLLRRLGIAVLGNAALAAADGRALAAAPLPQLRELRLFGVELGFVAALAAASWLSRLTSLNLAARSSLPDGGLAAAGGRILAAAPLLSLKRLVGVDSGFVAACAAGAWLSRLERLSLIGSRHLLGGGSGIPEGSAWALTPFTALASLALTYDEGGPVPASEAARFATLVAAPWFGRLRSLRLTR
jgi:hypothetical protein